VFDLLMSPTRFLFFTGKGGVGKTSLACAIAITLADSGKRVLLVSTDPASNLDQVLEVPLTSSPTAIPEVPGLLALNIDPEAAAEAYRERALGPLRGTVPDDELKRRTEELSGACTVEIAAFDEFTGLLTDDRQIAGFDHVIFDTAPTGHTLRLLRLPGAWSGFLDDNPNGASCLGPHTALAQQRAQFSAAVAALGDPEQTTLVLVSRPDRGAIREAARTSAELSELAMRNQHLVVNGVFSATDRNDSIALALEQRGREALAEMPQALASLPTSTVPLKPFNLVGAGSLRSLLA
jgi:arsenite/tail-anchored protein-transporting ATPase